MSAEFTVGGEPGEGVTFQLERLKVKASLGGLKLVGKVLLPALAEAHSAPAGHIGNAIQKVVEGLDCLPELLDLFAARTKFTHPVIGAGKTLPLDAKMLEDVFGGHPDWVLDYLVKCVEIEYGAFLSGKGPLAALVAKAKPVATPAA